LRFLPFPGGTKAIVDVVEVEAEVELLNAELVGGGGVELGVEVRLSGGVDNVDVWASIAWRVERSWAWEVDNSWVWCWI
jgi:hypothetical protein